MGRINENDGFSPEKTHEPWGESMKLMDLAQRKHMKNGENQ